MSIYVFNKPWIYKSDKEKHPIPSFWLLAQSQCSWKPSPACVCCYYWDSTLIAITWGCHISNWSLCYVSHESHNGKDDKAGKHTGEGVDAADNDRISAGETDKAQGSHCHACINSLSTRHTLWESEGGEGEVESHFTPFICTADENIQTDLFLFKMAERYGHFGIFNSKIKPFSAFKSLPLKTRVMSESRGTTETQGRAKSMKKQTLCDWKVKY